VERVRARGVNAGIRPAELGCDACEGLEIRNGGKDLKRQSGTAS